MSEETFSAIRPRPKLKPITTTLLGEGRPLESKAQFIPLHEDSQELTTFITPLGRCCFRRLPFGITSVAAIFMRKMSQLYGGVEGVFCYMDDVLVFGKDHKKRART